MVEKTGDFETKLPSAFYAKKLIITFDLKKNVIFAGNG
jgi:hypothetical protein